MIATVDAGRPVIGGEKEDSRRRSGLDFNVKVGILRPWEGTCRASNSEKEVTHDGV